VVGALACVGFLSAAPYRSHYGVATQTTGYAVLALTFGALLVQVIRAPMGSRLQRSLANERLRFFGRYSYGIYVLHGPLLGWLAAIGFSPAILPRLWGSALPGQVLFAAGALVVVTAAALLSWTLLEKPFLSLKRHFPSAATAAPAAPPAVQRAA
jgi:peptidoglycan/LPS O-acetylase OafA/YrhL